MITAVVMENDTDMTFNENAYPGMSLAEACKQFEMDIMSAINEFQMDILLKEHAYLYENACEITYVDEAGNENDNGKNLKDRLAKLAENASIILNRIFDKLMAWVLERIDQIHKFFGKAGITKNNANKLLKIYENYLTNNETPTVKLKWQADGAITEIYNKGFDKGLIDYSSYFKAEEDVKVDADLARTCINYVYSNDKIAMKHIVKMRRKSVDCVNGIIKDIKAKKNIDDNIEDYKTILNEIKTNTTGFVKFWHSLVTNYITVVRKVFQITIPIMRSQNVETAKNAMSSAGKAVKAAPGKAAGAAKKAFTKKEKATNESAEVDSEVYDGNYFRV